MIAWEAVSAAVLALSAIASGGVILRARVSPLTAWLLIAAGAVGALGLPTGVPLSLIVAWLVLLPAALWAYPIPRWQHPLDIVLGALLVGPGLVACTYSRDGNVVLTLAVVAFLALVAQSMWRLERSTGIERRALLWSSVTVGVATLVSLTMSFITDSLAAVSLAVLMTIPASMAVGVIKPETLDIRGLAVTASVVLTLLFGYIAYFAGTLALLSLMGAQDLSPIALALVGLAGGTLLHPAARTLRDVMDQLLFGHRPDPLDAATQVVGTIGSDPRQALDALRSALSLPYAALWNGKQVIAQSGEPVPHLRRVSNDQIDLEVGMRPGDLRLSAGDWHVLKLVTPLLAQLVRATELSAAVQQSRVRALTAMADERRRLRNELHDDLGPTLTGVAFSIDAARNMLPTDSPARELLTSVRSDTGDAIQQVRGLAYGMRPPALDELGLLKAVEQQARGLGVAVEFAVVGDIPSLPAAIEVAAYRILVEALTNVARHCQSSQARAVIDASQPGTLTVSVTDSDVNADLWVPGVGLASMRERLTELGGTFSAGPTPHGGCVRAQFPLSW